MKKSLPSIGYEYVRHLGGPRIGMLLIVLGCVVVAALNLILPELRAQQKSANPHGEMKMDCQRCHTTAGWKPVRSTPDFDHRTTRFALQGMHKGVSCRQCHSNLDFSKIGTQCSDCHADIHRRQLGSNCESCHSVRGWREISKNITGHTNRFPLLGAHAAVECESCHRSAAVGLFKGLRTDCVFCHSNDFRNAKAVDHVAAGFSMQCENCHGMDGWNRGFNHAAMTGFALLGAHARLDCNQCHPGGKFTGIPVDCVSCHLKDYNATVNPNHVAAGFPQNCAVCHNSAAWTPAVFDHRSTPFPLTGAHLRVACADCHRNGVYANTPTDCYACHAQAYAATTDPNHAAAGFPTACTQCHTTAAWTGATFTHSQFPINSGTHAGRWTTCADCHTNPANYAVFSCITCHEHDKTTSDGHHQGVSGYVYSATSCYSCHPTGRAD